jgi:acetyl esterase/lipase
VKREEIGKMNREVAFGKKQVYTLDNTYADIVEGPVGDHVKMLIGTLMFNNESILSLIPGNAHDKTWREIAETVRTPWDMPFDSQEIVDAANLSIEIFDENKWEIRSLWKEGQEVLFDNTKSGVCLFTPVMRPEEKRPGVIICPGGAYVTLAMVNEGFGVANRFYEHGYRPYILRYRRLPNLFPAQQEDLTLALLHVFANAERDGVKADDLMIAGFSAGGHLCSSTVTMIDTMKERVLTELEKDARVECYRKICPMPQKMILGYAVTEADSSLMGKLCPDRDKRDEYAAYRHVSSGMPKTYAWACEDDRLVPVRNTVEWAEAMQRAGNPCFLHIYPTGGHGIACGYGTSAEGWMDEMFEYM